MIELASPQFDAGLVSNRAEAMIAFYTEVLGFPLGGSVEIPHVGTVTRVQVGNSVLRILAPLSPAAPQAEAPSFTATSGIRYVALKVRGLAGAVEKVAAAGCRISVPIRTLRPGVEVALVEDPDGNTIELMEESAP
ncbi:MAG: VOC family protein [Sphingomonas sp.]|jgi:catechol 2,3-dioxygenase-like lactoylglutathione lyase family enzyme|uniref:VOC family protein n=1 Tax=Sphingomonas sp. TaxID=28214 RepID=UPI0035660DBF